MITDTWDKFAEWVDSFGEDAGDNMLLGAYIAILVISLVVGMIGVFTSLPLGIAGFAVFVVHFLGGLVIG